RSLPKNSLWSRESDWLQVRPPCPSSGTSSRTPRLDARRAAGEEGCPRRFEPLRQQAFGLADPMPGEPRPGAEPDDHHARPFELTEQRDELGQRLVGDGFL